MGIVRRIAYKAFGARVPLWEDLRKRRRVERLRADGTLITSVDSVIATLRLRGLLPEQPLIALEPFGRMGLWKTVDYVALCHTVDFYEIEEHFAHNARGVLPSNVTVHCQDSIRAIRSGATPRKDYNFVLVDNGLSTIFGDSYCEHFDMVPAVFDVVSSDAIIVANLFRSSAPLDAFESEYLRRRSEFFGSTNPLQPSFDEAIRAYQARLPARLRLREAFTVPHPRHPSIPHDEMHFVVLALGEERRKPAPKQLLDKRRPDRRVGAPAL